MLARTRRFLMVSLYLFYLHQICSQHQISVRRRFRELWKAIRLTHPKFPITADPRNVLPIPCVLLFPRLGRANLREGIDFGILRFVGRSIVSRHVHSATGPIADDSRKSTQRQTSGRVISFCFSLPLRDERSRTSNRKKNRFAEQSLLPWRVFQPFDPPLVLHQLPRNYFSLWTLYALTVRASSIVCSSFPKCVKNARTTRIFRSMRFKHG